MTPPQVRPARPDDCPALIALLHQLAAFEGSPNPPALTEDIARRDGFGPERKFEALLAVDGDDQPIGLALLLRSYSTWTAQPSLIVHDLIVSPDARAQGIGRALLAAVAALAEAESCGRVDLNVLDWNERAQRLYEKAGFQPLPFWRPYRLEAAGIKTLAQEARR